MPADSAAAPSTAPAAAPCRATAGAVHVRPGVRAGRIDLAAASLSVGMYLRRAAAALALAGLLLDGGAAQAWGPVGHRAVGAVADRLLRPAARAAVLDLLADDRDAAGRYSGRHTLEDVANWADEIRGGPGDEPRWHYDDRPVCAPAAAPDTWCVRGDCASAQLPVLLAVLADPQRPRAERNRALKWVVHLVGDLHQPLHAADLAEGGNQIRVRAATGSRGHGGDRRRRDGESLHAFWDSHLVNLALHPDDGSIAAPALEKLLRRARGADAADVAAGPEAWAEESNRIAREVALELPGVDCALARPPGHEHGPRTLVTVSPPRDYVARSRRIVQERLALAGARLAYLLNERLDPRGR